MKTKIFALSLALILISAVFTGCGTGGKTSESSTSASASSTATGVYTLPAGDGTYGSTTGTTAASTSATAPSSTSANVTASAGSTNTPVSIAPSTTFQSSEDTGKYTIGSYTVNTKTDPLSMRLAPMASDMTVTIRTIPKGSKVTVLAVHEDWGYVVYEGSGGWVAMKYLKAAS